MVDKIWLGGIFLKNEGGYEIVLKSLSHYKKRLQTIGNSPELKEAAAMFAPVLQQQAVKTIPKIVTVNGMNSARPILYTCFIILKLANL